MTQPQPISPRSPLQRLGTIDPHYVDALLPLVFTIVGLLTLLARRQSSSLASRGHIGGAIVDPATGRQAMSRTRTVKLDRTRPRRRGRVAVAALALAVFVLAGSALAATAQARAPLATDFAGAPAVASRSATIGSSDGGVTVKLGSDAIVRQGEKADSVVVVGGNAIVYGTVAHTVVAIGGDVQLKSTAVVGSAMGPNDASIVTVGGDVTREPGAIVIGKTTDIAGNWFGTVLSRGIWRSIVHPFRVYSVVGWFAQTIMFAIVALIVVAVAPRQVRAVKDQIKRRPLPALGWGALTTLIVVPVASIMLLITIIGILLLIPAWFIVLPIVGLLCFVGVASLIGETVISSKDTTRDNLMVTAVLGMVLISIVRFLPIAGFILFIALGMVGIGAGLLAGNEWRRARKSAPAIAAAAPPPVEGPQGDEPKPQT